MFRKVLFLMMFSGLCLATSYPVSGPVAGEQGFTTVQAAGTAGLQAIVAKTTGVEMAGGIYKFQGKFYYTNPTTNSNDAHFAIELAFPVGAKLVGLFHTHPNFPNNDMFSPNDIVVANQLDVTSFVGVIAGSSSHIIQYTPGVSKMASCDTCGASRLDYFHKVSYGSTIGLLKI